MDNIDYADVKEVLRFYTDVLRGEAETPSGQPPSLGDRLKAAEALMKRLTAEGGQREAMDKLDALLRELTDAAQR